ncbi:MAG: EthD family reductase [Myxococcota bacterium]
MYALARGSGAARACDGLRSRTYAASPDDAERKADGLLEVWSDAPPDVPSAHGYRVREVLHWDDGGVSPGLVAFYFVRRRPDLSSEAFEERYREGHAPLARVQHPGLRRYAQNFVEESTAGAPHWDAIAQLHFAGEREFRERFYRDAESPAIVAADVARFADLSTGFALVTRDDAGPEGT